MNGGNYGNRIQLSFEINTILWSRLPQSIFVMVGMNWQRDGGVADLRWEVGVGE